MSIAMAVENKRTRQRHPAAGSPFRATAADRARRRAALGEVEASQAKKKKHPTVNRNVVRTAQIRWDGADFIEHENDWRLTDVQAQVMRTRSSVGWEACTSQAEGSCTSFKI
jgi:hypothetical protein